MEDPVTFQVGFPLYIQENARAAQPGKSEEHRLNTSYSCFPVTEVVGGRGLSNTHYVPKAPYLWTPTKPGTKWLEPSTSNEPALVSPVKVYGIPSLKGNFVVGPICQRHKQDVLPFLPLRSSQWKLERGRRQVP